MSLLLFCAVYGGGADFTLGAFCEAGVVVVSLEKIVVQTYFKTNQMNLNYTAFFFISFVPLIFAAFWYHPNSPMRKKWNMEGIINPLKLSIPKKIFAFILSVAFVYAYMNLVIHQLGFYELFFTDIMKGNAEAKQIVDEFLAEYGEKHRHFGHGVLHGLINAFILPLPIIGFQAILQDKPMSFIYLHFGYWLVMSMLIGGLIAAFI